MPYTVHTLDGQAHTYPDPCTARFTDAGLLTLHEYGARAEDHGDPISYPLLAAYPAGQWTHYHVEPTPYKTDYSTADEEHHEDEGQPTAPAKGKDKWQAEFQRHLNAGRKAAEAQ